MPEFIGGCWTGNSIKFPPISPNFGIPCRSFNIFDRNRALQRLEVIPDSGKNSGDLVIQYHPNAGSVTWNPAGNLFLNCTIHCGTRCLRVSLYDADQFHIDRGACAGGSADRPAYGDEGQAQAG